MALHIPSDGPVVQWHDGDPIAGSDFRRAITADDTDGRFCLLKATMPTDAFVWPHTHTHEDEITFVHRGKLGARVGDSEVVVEEGGFLFKPRGIPHAMWNLHNEVSLLHELITPAGFEGLFEEMGLWHVEGRKAPPAQRQELAARYGLHVNEELVADLAERHSLRP